MRQAHRNNVHKSLSLHVTNQFNKLTPYFMERYFLRG